MRGSLFVGSSERKNRPSSRGRRISLGADVERGVCRDPAVPEARMIVTGDNRGRTLISLHRTPINEGIPHAPPTPHRRHPLVPRSVRGHRPARLEHRDRHERPLVFSRHLEGRLLDHDDRGDRPRRRPPRPRPPPIPPPPPPAPTPPPPPPHPPPQPRPPIP